jgi:hypothetical protein
MHFPLYNTEYSFSVLVTQVYHDGWATLVHSVVLVTRWNNGNVLVTMTIHCSDPPVCSSKNTSNNTTSCTSSWYPHSDSLVIWPIMVLWHWCGVSSRDGRPQYILGTDSSCKVGYPYPFCINQLQYSTCMQYRVAKSVLVSGSCGPVWLIILVQPVWTANEEPCCVGSM